MNKASQWMLSGNPQGNDGERSADTLKLISERPTQIVITRLDPQTQRTIQLPPQTVRIEVVSPGKETHDGIMSISQNKVVVIGVKGSPAVPDFNCQRADLFFVGNQQYEVISVVAYPGQYQAECLLTP